MYEYVDALAITQNGKDSSFEIAKVGQLFRSGNYNTIIDNDDNIGNNIRPFIANQKNKERCIYVSNNNIKEAISELADTKFCNGTIFLMMNEPTKSDVTKITQLPEHIRPIILRDLYQSPTYKNPVLGIPLVSYKVKDDSTYVTYKNGGSNNLRFIIDEIKESEKIPNHSLTLALDTPNSILNQQTPTPKKINPNNQQYTYIGYTIGFGLLLSWLFYKSGITKKLLHSMH